MTAFKNGDKVVWSENAPGYTKAELDKKYGKGPHELCDVGESHARLKGNTGGLFSFAFFEHAPKEK